MAYREDSQCPRCGHMGMSTRSEVCAGCTADDKKEKEEVKDEAYWAKSSGLSLEDYRYYMQEIRFYEEEGN